MEAAVRSEGALHSGGASRAPTLVEMLRWRASHQAERPAYTFLANGEAEEARRSCAELDARARAIGAGLQAGGSAGARALLLYPPGLDFIDAFFGCLYAGVVAVPAPLPDPVRLKRTLPRLSAVIDDAGATLILTTSQALPGLPELAASTGLPCLQTDAMTEGAERWQPPAIDAETLAFLQYTSGSTQSPKGVMVRHGALLRHCADVRAAWGYDDDAVAATWLPHFHDYGLIDGVIQPVYAGIPTYLMSPVAFYMRPLRWLKAIAQHGVTHSQAPNFGYEHCIERIKPLLLEGLDLSRWRVASNGSEPIDLQTLERFAALLAPCGFRRAAFYPAYGLAEATLLVATKRHGVEPGARALDADALQRHHAVDADESVPPPRRRTVVSCGPAIGATRVAIVDPERGTPLAPRQVGEIWVASDSLAAGYWQRADASVETFGARLDPDDGRAYLRTGDLGFLCDGELYITGRIKDLIIIRGRNHYPHDIELTVARAHPALRAGHGAAFGIDVQGRERLLVVQEVRAQALDEAAVSEIVGNIREAVSDEHEIQVHRAVLVRPGTIPKTSSGKIQRSACRQRYLDGALDVLAPRPG
ncbi:MAG: fatty acyl-AMP ligase [Proteobacteria bacterium]|nr:fatty acyl-AMP ligase [Pseudomonadota bacterium]